MKSGSLDFGWLSDARERVEIHPKKPRRGLTVADCDVGPYAIAAQPEIVRDNRAMAPRGALIPGAGEVIRQQPDLGPSLNRKSDVWAYRVQSYWEEAVSRQWNATTDIPWQDLEKCDVPDSTRSSPSVSSARRSPKSRWSPPTYRPLGTGHE